MSLSVVGRGGLVQFVADGMNDWQADARWGGRVAQVGVSTPRPPSRRLVGIPFGAHRAVGRGELGNGRTDDLGARTVETPLPDRATSHRRRPSSAAQAPAGPPPAPSESSSPTPRRPHPATGTAATGTVGRALRILDAFCARQPAMTLSELARRSGLPVSTVHRMLGDLVSWGALERGADGRYRVGLRLWELGSLCPRGQGLRERLLPFLEDLSQITHENVQLAVREGSDVVYVERIAGTGAVPVLTRVGGRFAMTATGVGLVLLAHAPAEVQEHVLAGPLERFTPHTVTDPRALRRMLADVRANGYAVSDRQVTSDALSVAAPVCDGDGTALAAVSLVVRHGGASPHALARLVCTSARAMSRVLAMPPSYDGLHSSRAPR